MRKTIVSFMLAASRFDPRHVGAACNRRVERRIVATAEMQIEQGLPQPGLARRYGQRAVERGRGLVGTAQHRAQLGELGMALQPKRRLHQNRIELGRCGGPRSGRELRGGAAEQPSGLVCHEPCTAAKSPPRYAVGKANAPP